MLGWPRCVGDLLLCRSCAEDFLYNWLHVRQRLHFEVKGQKYFTLPKIWDGLKFAHFCADAGSFSALQDCPSPSGISGCWGFYDPCGRCWYWSFWSKFMCSLSLFTSTLCTEILWEQIGPEISIAQEKKVRREQGFHVGWGLSCWYYSRAASQINWVYLPQLLMLLVTCTGQVCSWKNEVLWLQQSKAVPKAPSPEWRYSQHCFTEQQLHGELVSQPQQGLGDIPRVTRGNLWQSKDPQLVCVL